MKFILSRTEDYRLHSKKWIVGYGLLFWLITRIIAAGFVIGCTAVYNAFGVNPEEMTKFGGDPSTVKSVYTVGYGIALAILIAPVMEECIFRLGLSFRKWQISLGLAAIGLHDFSSGGTPDHLVGYYFGMYSRRSIMRRIFHHNTRILEQSKEEVFPCSRLVNSDSVRTYASDSVLSFQLRTVAVHAMRDIGTIFCRLRHYVLPRQPGFLVGSRTTHIQQPPGPPATMHIASEDTIISKGKAYNIHRLFDVIREDG